MTCSCLAGRVLALVVVVIVWKALSVDAGKLPSVRGLIDEGRASEQHRLFDLNELPSSSSGSLRPDERRRASPAEPLSSRHYVDLSRHHSAISQLEADLPGRWASRKERGTGLDFVPVGPRGASKGETSHVLPPSPSSKPTRVPSPPSASSGEEWAPESRFKQRRLEAQVGSDVGSRATRQGPSRASSSVSSLPLSQAVTSPSAGKAMPVPVKDLSKASPGWQRMMRELQAVGGQAVMNLGEPRPVSWKRRKYDLENLDTRLLHSRALLSKARYREVNREKLAAKSKEWRDKVRRGKLLAQARMEGGLESESVPSKGVEGSVRRPSIRPQELDVRTEKTKKQRGPLAGRRMKSGQRGDPDWHP